MDTKLTRKKVIQIIKAAREEGVSPDLRNAYLSKANLIYVNFRGANLSGAELTEAELSGANLMEANLSGADLSRANLRGTNLTGAELFGANLANVKIDSRTKLDQKWRDVILNSGGEDLEEAMKSRRRNDTIISLTLGVIVGGLIGGLIGAGSNSNGIVIGTMSGAVVGAYFGWLRVVGLDGIEVIVYALMGGLIGARVGQLIGLASDNDWLLIVGAVVGAIIGWTQPGIIMSRKTHQDAGLGRTGQKSKRMPARYPRNKPKPVSHQRVKPKVPVKRAVPSFSPEELSQMTVLKTAPPAIELVTVPAGEFIMGLDGAGPAYSAHRLTLAEYQIGRYLITNAQYLPFMRDTGHPAPLTWSNDTFPAEQADHPVSGVTWADAWLFCAWLRYKTKQPYHLPTEAQWEKAATWNPATGRKQPYPWGDEPDDGLCNLAASGHYSTTPVGSYSPQGDSPYGCADMIGNVDEWCNTAMWEYPYRTDDGREELTAPGRRCIREGDWYTITNPTGSRRNAPSDWWQYLWGFRVALSPVVDESHQELIRQYDEIVPKTTALFEAELEQNPKRAQVYYNYGTRLLEFSRRGVDCSKEVEQILTQALELANNDRNLLDDNPLSHVYFNRAMARKLLRDYEGAVADLTQAIELDKSDADAFMRRAEIACDLERWSQAKQDLTTALRLKPKHTSELKIRARIRAGQGDWQTALDLLTQFIKQPLFTPLWLPKVYLWRAQVYEQLGQPDKAISDYYHYLLWRPEAPETDGIIRKMQAFLNRS